MFSGWTSNAASMLGLLPGSFYQVPGTGVGPLLSMWILVDFSYRILILQLYFSLRYCRKINVLDKSLCKSFTRKTTACKTHQQSTPFPGKKLDLALRKQTVKMSKTNIFEKFFLHSTVLNEESGISAVSVKLVRLTNFL